MLSLLILSLMPFCYTSLPFTNEMWDLSGQPNLINLVVEYTSVDGNSVVMIQDDVAETNNSLQLIYIHGYMGYFPENICQYTTIVKIDLTDNKIKYIGNISCLLNLELLNLKQNALTRLLNLTFVHLLKLKTLDISENQILEIEPYSLVGPNLNISWMNASYNNFTEVDVTNFVSVDSFCVRDFSHNNPLTIWPEFDKLGAPDLSWIGKLWEFGFDFRGANLTCNCQMEPFLTLALKVIKRIWTDIFNVTCSHPHHLKGTPILDLVMNSSRLSELVCPIDSENDCPIGCNCTEQPSNSRLIVDCQRVGLTELPLRLPNTSLSYELNVCNNKISVLNKRNYLGKVTVLNACNNENFKVDEAFIYMMTNITILSLANNRGFLKHLPKTIQFLPAQSLDVRNLVLYCDCDSIWLSEWLEFREVESDTVYCHTANHGRINAIYLDKVLSDECQIKDFTTMIVCICIALLLILITVPIVLFNNFQHELTILFRRQDNSDYNFEYDVYISFDDNNERLREWIRHTVLPFLENCGHRIYLPMRDALPGNVVEERVHELLRQTKCFVVVLSASYLCQRGRPQTDIEWKYAWDLYVKDRHRKIVIINFDHLSTSVVDPPQIKAFIRTGKVLNFGNRDGMHLNNIQAAIGHARRRHGTLGPPQRLFSLGLLRKRSKVDIETINLS
ncbi:hypothetical protein ACJMK2_043864 [Sinanodonta woodiana]|uniref:TIR domain-containing protein n=1 Tax=Sinanodonta woodiana TaxID=1069815 RepID=A0ABD3VZI0_SINWO